MQWKHEHYCPYILLLRSGGHLLPDSYADVRKTIPAVKKDCGQSTCSYKQAKTIQQGHEHVQATAAVHFHVAALFIQECSLLTKRYEQEVTFANNRLKTFAEGQTRDTSRSCSVTAQPSTLNSQNSTQSTQPWPAKLISCYKEHNRTPDHMLGYNHQSTRMLPAAAPGKKVYHQQMRVTTATKNITLPGYHSYKLPSHLVIPIITGTDFNDYHLWNTKGNKRWRNWDHQDSTWPCALWAR